MSVYQTHSMTVDINSREKSVRVNSLMTSGESNADAFVIDVMDGDVPLSLTGKTVQAKMIRRCLTSQADTVVITGRTYGNTAEIVLPQACYAYSGEFVLTIWLCDSVDDLRVICAFTGNIVKSSSGNEIDPGSVVPDITALLAQLQACEDATDAANAAADHAVRYDAVQSLTEAQKARARANIGVTGGGGSGGAVIDDTSVSSLTAWSSAKINAELNKRVQMPVSPGVSGQVLMLDGNGNIIWGTVTGGGTEMEIRTYAISGSSVHERGVPFDSVTFSFTLSKIPQTMSIDGISQTPAKSGSVTLDYTDDPITANKSFELVVSDGTDTVRRSVSVSFENNVIWGVSALPSGGTVDGAFISALANKTPSGNKGRTIRVTSGQGEYVWYAVPKNIIGYMNCIFTKSGSLSGGFDTRYDSGVVVQNRAGENVEYFVYRSDYDNFGADVDIIVT